MARLTKPPVIIIKIIASMFKDIMTTAAPGLGRCTPIDRMLIRNRDGAHDVDAVNKDVLVNASTNFRFRIESDVTPNPFYPIGIAFTQTNPFIPPSGNIEDDNIERLGLDVHDPVNRIAEKNEKHILVVGCKERIRGNVYKYHLFIQDGRDGRIGVIDPKMIHTSTNPNPFGKRPKKRKAKRPRRR